MYSLTHTRASSEIMATRFGDWLKAERQKRGWSQDQLGAEVGLTKAQISRLETGKQGTKRDTAVRIAHGMGANPQSALSALMTDTEGLDIQSVPPGFIKVKIGEYAGKPVEILLSDTVTEPELSAIRMAFRVATTDPNAE
jgi:transcriptional regulator with XRE-family HTH domain